MSGRSTRESLAEGAPTTQFGTFDARLQYAEETQGRMAQIHVKVSGFMRAGH